LANIQQSDVCLLVCLDLSACLYLSRLGRQTEGQRLISLSVNNYVCLFARLSISLCVTVLTSVLISSRRTWTRGRSDA